MHFLLETVVQEPIEYSFFLGLWQCLIEKVEHQNFVLRVLNLELVKNLLGFLLKFGLDNLVKVWKYEINGVVYECFSVLFAQVVVNHVELLIWSSNRVSQLCKSLLKDGSVLLVCVTVLVKQNDLHK